MYRSLEITTAIGCHNACKCCPQGPLVREYGASDRVMSLRTFGRILDNTPADVRIDWSGYCEPFQNPAASEMMMMAKDRRQVMYTTLVGVTEAALDRIASLRFEVLMVHFPDQTHFLKKDVSGIGPLFERLLKDHPYLETMSLAAVDTRLAQYTRTRPYHIPPILSRASNGGMVQMRKSGPLACQRAGKAFSQNVVLPNGDTYLCCCDYSLKHRLGNLLTTHYDRLDRASFQELAGGHDSEIICRGCEWAVQ